MTSALGNDSEIPDDRIVFIRGWDREADQGSVSQVRDPATRLYCPSCLDSRPTSYARGAQDRHSSDRDASPDRGFPLRRAETRPGKRCRRRREKIPSATTMARGPRQGSTRSAVVRLLRSGPRIVPQRAAIQPQSELLSPSAIPASIRCHIEVNPALPWIKKRSVPLEATSHPMRSCLLRADQRTSSQG